MAVLEEMIVEVAKAEFLKDHPDRHRSPRGFTQDIGLMLTGIEEGSAVLDISLRLAPRAEFFRQDQIYFERARDAIINAISAAQQDVSITAHLPEKVLNYFDKIGRSLRGDEAIEFTSPTHPSPAKLTRETRRRLLLASSEVRELTEEISVRGAVPEADQDDMTFEIQLINGQKIKAPIAPQHMDTILETFNGYKNNARVLLQGIGRFNRGEKLLGFDSIEHINILDDLDISAQLDDLRLIKNGWLEGEGLAPPPEELDWLSRVFDDHYPENLPLPYLYPTEEGGVQVEWSLKQNEVTLRIDLGNHAGGWHTLNMETDADASCTLNLDSAEDWDWVGRQIQRMSESKA